MKLYTEEQVNFAMRYATVTKDSYSEVLKQLIPIELPSDEEIDKLLERKSSVNLLGFITGVKWMKKLIYNQNNQTYDGVRIKRFIKDEGEQILNQNK
jgi:hypothetical protein